MSPIESEDELLRSVALQNAKSILLARQRAEEELVRAKEALESKTHELARSLAMMHATLESTTDGILVTDRVGNVTGYNERFVEMWKLADDSGSLVSHDNILAQTNKSFEEPVAYLSRINEIYDSSPPETYDVLKLADGQVFERFSSTQVVEGENVGRVWSFRDITSRAKAEDQVRASEQRFRQLADAMPQIVWTAGPDGTVDYFNHRWYEYFDPDGASMERGGWVPFVHPDDEAASRRMWEASLTTGAPYEIEFRLLQADGNYCWYLARALPVTDESQDQTKWFGTFTDVNEERQRAEDLRRVAAKLSEADRRKDEFLAMLAHELRNPLAPIRNTLHVLQTTEEDPERVSSLDMMDRQVGQLVRLVDDLLDVSRISRGKIDLRVEDIDLTSVISDAVEAARPSCADGGVDLSVKTLDTPIILRGDPTRLNQALGNLLNNSCKFTDRGGTIEVTVECDEAEADITIRDTGIGIDPRQLPYIFDIFVQADTSLERRISGLGIGLTLVKNLVELHGGSVRARSKGLGHGAEFSVRLPVSNQLQKLPSEQARSGMARAGNKRRVLVVDDNVDSAESLTLLLEILGHEVKMVHDGIDAVETAASFRPEVVLLDIGLPRLNGYEAAQRIRREAWGKDIFLIALTGWGQEEDRRRSKDAGFNYHLVKPVDPDELARHLDELGEGSQARA